MKKLLILSTLSLGALALTSGSAQAALLTIDNFNDGVTDERLQGPAPKNFTQTVTAPGIVGGSRNIDFDLTEGTNRSRRADLFINDENDTLSLSNGNRTNSTVAVSYGPGLGQTLVSPGGSFEFPIISSDGVGVELELSVNGSPFQSVPLGGLAGGNAIFPSSLFGDPTSLDSLTFKIVGSTGFDVEIDQVGYRDQLPDVLPEPMTILGTVFVLGALPKLKKAYGNKKA
jgi:hypothetical protein